MRTYKPHALPVQLRTRANAKFVSIGSTVVVRDLDSNEVESYQIVAANQADIANSRISTLTPAGRAFYGRRAGEVVHVEAPGGTFYFKIESVTSDSCLEERAADRNDADDLAAFAGLKSMTA